MADPTRKDRIERSFAGISDRLGELGEEFYTTLFARSPNLRTLFPKDMAAQRTKFIGTLVQVVAKLRMPEAIEPLLGELGERHVSYGTKPAHYDAIRDALLAALQRVCGESWSEQLEADWTWLIDRTSEAMLRGARANQS